MKKSILNLLIIVSFIPLFSCSEEEDDPLKKEYLEIVVNGKKYDAIAEEWSNFDTETCDEKSGTRVNVGEIETSDFYLDLHIMHYTNLDDFTTADKGNYSIRNSLSINNICNFEAVVRFKDYTQGDYLTSVKDGGTNTITEIEKLDENSDIMLYGIKGNFNCTRINISGEEISVMGNYYVLVLVWIN
ncbi:hypothetical protein [Maribellus sediminis]|uniref:hypothetical protein n=1 Tax=Maribellus sediminis TaxID=2696285 RepID=UPI0014312D0D|nr:hypothetical protein [Maribellus sediminis]